MLSLVWANAATRISHPMPHVWFLAEVNPVHLLELLVIGPLQVLRVVRPLSHRVALILLLLRLGRFLRAWNYIARTGSHKAL